MEALRRVVRLASQDGSGGDAAKVIEETAERAAELADAGEAALHGGGTQAGEMVAALSQIPNLEPLCGIALAFNLAYLNLKIFRYRQKVAKIARRTLGRLGGEDPEGHKLYARFPWYWNACLLANSPDYPCDGKKASKNLKRMSWHKYMRRLFGKRIDIYLSVAFSVISGIYLVLGVAHSMDWWPATHWLGDGGWLYFGFVALVLAIVAPTFFVLKGRDVVDGGRIYLADQVEMVAAEIDDNLQTEAERQAALLRQQAEELHRKAEELDGGGGGDNAPAEPAEETEPKPKSVEKPKGQRKPKSPTKKTE